MEIVYGLVTNRLTKWELLFGNDLYILALFNIVVYMNMYECMYEYVCLCLCLYVCGIQDSEGERGK